MEFTNKNSKKLKLILAAAGILASFSMADRSAHASPQQDKFDTCMDVEIDDGKEEDQIIRECCEGAGGVVFGENSDHGTSFECVFANELLEFQI